MDSIILAIISLLQANLRSGWNVYYGSIRSEAQAKFPLVTVAPVSTDYSVAGTNGLRKVEQIIAIRPMVFLREHIPHVNTNTVSQVQELVKVIEETEADGSLKSDTILGILNENLSLNNKTDIVSVSRGLYEQDLSNQYASAVMQVTTNKIIC